MWQERILSKFLLKLQTKKITLNVTNNLNKIKYLGVKALNQKPEKKFLDKGSFFDKDICFSPNLFLLKPGAPVSLVSNFRVIIFNIVDVFLRKLMLIKFLTQKTLQATTVFFKAND